MPMIISLLPSSIENIKEIPQESKLNHCHDGDTPNI
jgi:hypothetical protein